MTAQVFLPPPPRTTARIAFASMPDFTMVIYNSSADKWTLAAEISEIRKIIWNAKDPFVVMIRAYLECMLWSSTDVKQDDEGNDVDFNLDEDHDIDDISDELITSSVIDCAKLFTQFRFDNHNYVGKQEGDFDVHSQAGYDFWLTRAGHGCGFWEKSDWEESFGEAVTEYIRENFRNIDPYVGDGYIGGKKKIYAM